MCFHHYFYELGQSWHRPPRQGTESVNTFTVVLVHFPVGALICDMFSNCRHTIQKPYAFQIPGSHGMLNYSIVLAPSQKWSGFCVFHVFQDTAQFFVVFAEV